MEDSRRDVTEIKDLSAELLYRMEGDKEIGIELYTDMKKGLFRIMELATNLDARTGTLDPRLKDNNPKNDG